MTMVNRVQYQERNCPGCDYECPPDFAFCPKCGTPLGPVVPKTPGLVPDQLAERLQRLVPRTFAERLLATKGQLSRERRTVTILFCDVKGSTSMAEELDPEDWMEIMDGAFDVLIEPIYRYEGTVARLMGDAILAFFGAPIAHEDDPERACRAALAILEGARRYAAQLEVERGIAGFTVRVGIHTGLVVVGEVGSDLRVEYTAMGDAVNLASRMEQSAPPGGILITHDTYRHVRGIFDVLAQEPLTVKGKSEPVQTYLVQRAKPRAFRTSLRGVEGIETRMVGREAELKHLQEAYQTALEDGELQIVTVSGEAGVGKSRLLYEFDTWAELLPERFYYFEGRAGRETQTQPYGLLRDLIAFRFQIQDSDSAASVRQKLEEGVAVALGTGDSSRQAGHLIGLLLGYEFGDSVYLSGIGEDPQGTRDRALGHLIDYFRALADKLPVLILLEDLHWADDSSLDALNELAKALVEEPVMVACAARPSLFERRPHWGEVEAFHTRLDLQPLSRGDSRRLVAEILQKVEQVSEALRDLVVSGAEGNPFFIEELIKMLVEDGVVVKEEEVWRLEMSRLAEVRVPPTLNGVLQARLDRLPPAERTILQEASVVGRLFWDRAVARIHESARQGGDESEVLHSLLMLRSKEMIFQRKTSAFAGAGEYLFKHALLREVTYGSLLKRLRRVYHGVVADWLLEQGGERTGEYTSLVADHLTLAGRTVESLKYLLQAGDRARRLYASHEAVGCYRRALALQKEHGDDEGAARTLMKLGLTYHNAFDFRQARRAYEEGFALWQRAGELHRQALQPSPPAPHALRVDWADPPTLDPTRAWDLYSASVIDQLFSGLVAYGPEMGVTPDVAQGWEVSRDGRRYVFRLRDGVQWIDGTPVTAGDFEYAWKRVLDPASESANAKLLYDVKGARALHRGEASDADRLGVRALDEATLMVELEEPSSYFLSLLAHRVTYPLPRHTVQDHGERWAEVGTILTNGPFRLESWRRGESLVLVRNPGYHGRAAGNVQQLELLLVPEWPVKLQMYEADSLDIMNLAGLPLPERERIRHRFAGEYVSAPTLGTIYVGFDTSRPPFDDPIARRAFVLAIDREYLIFVVMKGDHLSATGGFIPPGMPAYSAEIGLPHDPNEARRCLAELRSPTGHSLEAIDFLTFRRLESYGAALVAQWQKILGIEIAWEAVEYQDFLTRMATRPPRIFLSGWTADYLDPDNFLRVSPIRSYTCWRDSDFHRLVETARRVNDQAERISLYTHADAILIRESAIVPIAYARRHLLVKPWIKTLPMSSIQHWFWKDVVIEPH